MGDIQDMKNLNETEKNMFTCAILMIVVGISMIALGKTTFGICSAILGVFFGVVGFINMKNNSGDDKK